MVVLDGPGENQRRTVHLGNFNTQQVFGLHNPSPGQDVRAQSDGHRPPKTRDRCWTGRRGRRRCENRRATGRVSGRTDLPRATLDVARFPAAQPNGAVGEQHTNGVRPIRVQRVERVRQTEVHQQTEVNDVRTNNAGQVM